MSKLQISATMRIAIGLAFLSVTVLLAAVVLKIIPDRHSSVVEGRKALCETIAVSCSLLARQDETDRMRATLVAVVKRNPDILSAAIRRQNGRYLAEVNDHRAHWDVNSANGDYSLVSVPVVASNQEPWGTVELRFRSLAPQGRFAVLQYPIVKLMIFFPAASLLFSFIYLKKMLRHMDPSKVVPGRVRSALDSLAGGVVVLDDKGRIVLSNESFASAIGSSSQELVGSRIADLLWEAADDEASTDEYDWLKSIEEGEAQPSILLSLPKSDVERLTFMVKTTPILGDQGRHRGILVSLDDVTELQKKEMELKDMLEALTKSREEIRLQNDELKKLATQDPLTGCLNRRSFFERFETIFNTAVRYDEPLSCIMLDLDHFKSINDEHGHSMGDLVLKKVAATLKQTVRDADLVCRYGGEEFCILLPHLDVDNAAAAAERYRQAIANIVFPELTVTASIGVSTVVKSTSDPQALLDEADKCLYVAKRQGRNRVVRWDKVPDDIEIDESKISRAAPPESDANTSIPFHAVTALVSALGYRDASTADHSRRVADLCVATASGLLSSTECYTLEIAALLHDIGKIGVPDSILLKPGPLTREEWEIMGVHDRIGVEIVNSAFDCPELTEIIESHHAFFGGKGRYENLPRGREIPVAARILSIADSYDAIVSDRVYRKGASQEDAFIELRRCAGTQFDPELTERFIQAVIDRDENRNTALEPVSKQSALRVGSEIERLACAIDDRDKASLEALASRLQLTANSHGIPRIAEVAAELEKLAAEDAEMAQLVELTHTLMDLCRATQSAFLERITETVPSPLSAAASDDQPLLAETTSR